MVKVPWGVGILLPSVVRNLASDEHLAEVARVVVLAHRIHEALRQVVVGHAILAAVHDHGDALHVLTCLTHGVVVLAGLEPQLEGVVESLRLGLNHFLGGRVFDVGQRRLAALIKVALAYEACVAVVVGVVHDGVVEACVNVRVGGALLPPGALGCEELYERVFGLVLAVFI